MCAFFILHIVVVIINIVVVVADVVWLAERARAPSASDSPLNQSVASWHGVSCGCDANELVSVVTVFQ